MSSNSKGTRGCGSHDVPALKRPAVKAERVGRRECPPACASRRTRQCRPMPNRMAANPLPE
ncbi:hypothetical protein C7S14_2895 [Burkholderia cepacia]|nr:hypothetical protein C7S14_2895 [Burkholderia cepacia]